MKKSIVKLTVVLVAFVTVSILRVNAQSQPAFLYNAIYEGGRAVSKEICKLDRSSGLYNRHLSYEYTYTDDGLLESRRTSRWDEATRGWENEAVIAYSYDDLLSRMTVEYAEWDKASGAFSEPTEKAIYYLMSNKSVCAYTAYEKERPEMNWIIREHFNRDDQFTAQVIQ
ncbi:MAG: DUF3836 domain-containing protein [Tannerellaceae bacterium]|jgi:hypothetical protein|nr:DUF3836 domain-containing protein [Tannerellaceae bacterium]